LPKLPDHLAKLSKSELESICVDCGLCCHANVEVEKGVTALIPDLTCKHLRVEDDGVSRCSIYGERHEIAKEWCLPLADAIDKAIFPKTCPYVTEMVDYTGALVLSDDTYKSVRNTLQKSLVTQEKPEWLSDVSWAKFLFLDD